MSETTGWRVWTYSLNGGWSPDLPVSTREEAREIRESEHIEHDGYPPEFVAIRRASEPGPQRRPPQAVIDRAVAQLAEGVDR